MDIAARCRSRRDHMLRRVAVVAVLLAAVVALPPAPAGASSGFSRAGAFSLAAGEDNLTAAVIDPSAQYAYFGTNTAPGRLVRVSLTELGGWAGSITLPAGTDFLRSAVMDPAGNFAYFGTNTTPAKVVRVDLASFPAESAVSSITLGPGENSVVSAVMDPDGESAYFGTDTSPARVVKVDLATFTPVATLTLPDDSALTAAVIDPTGRFAYFGTNTSPAKVVKVDLDAFTRAGALTLPTTSPAETHLRSAVMDPAGEFAYFGTGIFGGGAVVKIGLSPFERTGSLQIAPNGTGLLSAVIDPNGRFAYFGAGTLPGTIAKVDLDAFQPVGLPLALDAGEDNPAAAVVDASGQYAYFGTITSPGRVVKIHVGLPDLHVTAVSDPPSSKEQGTSFAVTDTTDNQGTADGGASQTRYYLSADTDLGPGDPPLDGARAVPALARGPSSTGTVDVTIPTTVPAGHYWLWACADDGSDVEESNEGNNCLRATGNKLAVTPPLPDLAVTDVVDPPASRRQGATVDVTETVRNQGTAAAGASTTRFYLSANLSVGEEDHRLDNDRAVPSLAVGQSSAGTVQATIPTTVPPGDYWLFACADDTDLVTESDEANNCRPSTTQMEVTPAATEGDFTGDGATDRSFFRPSIGRWYVNGGTNLTMGTSTDIPVPRDYTGDGATDYAFYRPSIGRWYLRGATNVTMGTATDVPVPADYTGDGVTDVAFYRPSIGRWYIRGATNINYGTATDVPVPADYDGDGDTDVAFYRPSTGRWHVYGASSNVTFGGASGDVPVPGDYDGDGAAELAFFRPSIGRWYIKDGTNVNYGMAGDVPVPGDYDGDGDTDVAVFRPSTGHWHVRGVAGSVKYGAAGDIPLPLPHAIYSTYFNP